MKSFERKIFPYLMLAPTLLVFGVFLFYPALNGVWISLTKWEIHRNLSVFRTT